MNLIKNLGKILTIDYLKKNYSLEGKKIFKHHDKHQEIKYSQAFNPKCLLNESKKNIYIHILNIYNNT